MITIAIVSQKGGAGKTTLAISLAAEAERVGQLALVIDLDPQATASQWASWRHDRPPEVIDSAPPRLAAKIAAAQDQGATFIVIDTPPHSDSAATRAVDVADLVLIPCRPSAFDLAAIKTTVQLVRVLGKPAAVVFTAGPAHAPRLYEEAAQLIRDTGVPVCPHSLPDRAIYRHASAAGQTVIEADPDGKAAAEIAQLYRWAITPAHRCTITPSQGAV